MNVRTLVASESDVTDLACLLRVQHSFQCSSGGKNAVRVGVANYLVELEEIDSVSLKTTQRVVDLIRSSGLGASVDLGHEKSFFAVTIAQRFAHADLTLAAVVIPAVVEKIDALIQTSANDTNAFLGISLFAKMIATETNERDFFSAAAQRSIRNVIFGFRSRRLLTSVRK